MRLLAVERQASSLTSKLPENGTFVVRTDTPDDALSMLRHERYDLVVLDLASLPESGLKFLRCLRAAGDETPVVAITSRQSGDRVRALSLGADDAVDQHTDVGELTARIQAVFRRHRGYSRSVLEVGDLSLSVETREVRFKNRLIHLTGREYLTLELLVFRRGQFVTKDMFLNHLYGGMDEPDTKIIDVFICKLRKKLTAAGADGTRRCRVGSRLHASRPDTSAAADLTCKPLQANLFGRASDNCIARFLPGGRLENDLSLVHRFYGPTRITRPRRSCRSRYG